MKRLRDGVIFEIARAAGIEVPARRPKAPIRCPLHEDAHASAFLSETNVFFCSVCTPNGGMTAKRFASALEISWDTHRPKGPLRFPVQTPTRTRPPPEPTFTPTYAAQVWRLAGDRVRNDDCVDSDRDAYEYLASRGLVSAWEHDAFGILSDDMNLPAAIAWWPSEGYRVIAPLYDAGGSLSAVQARSIRPNPRKKTVFPRGCIAKGTAFINHSGLSLLRGTWDGDPRVVLGEGLTDYLALTITSHIPVLCAPGTGMAKSVIGPWVRGRFLVLALDNDRAGDRATQPTADRAYRLGARRVSNLRWGPGCNDACDQLRSFGEPALADLLECAPKEVR